MIQSLLYQMRNNPSETEMFETHANELKSLHLRNLVEDPARAPLMRISAAGITLDFSHQRILPETLSVFDAFATSQDLHSKMQALMRGDCVNISEARPALHTALRDFSDDTVIHVNNEDIMPHIRACRQQMKALCEHLKSSSVQDVVVLGIGGSYWGSAAVYQALQDLPRRVNVHFLGDMEEEAFTATVAGLTPASTTFLVISKSFTTPETLFNARLARTWLATTQDNSFPHLIAVTANASAAQAFGIAADHTFDMWSWVGGRYSVWSAVGLPVAICYGFDVFEALLKGASIMDKHTLQAETRSNLPMIAALCTYLNTRYFEAETEAVLPYGFRWSAFIPYLQQLSMESLGKQRTLSGEKISAPTGPIVWGQTGLHAQHTFNQLLHQGNHCVGVDFIFSLKNKILANACLAQSYALTYGDPTNPSPFARIEGNQPHQLISYEQLTPEVLGALMAYFEHKTYLLACLLGINAFDQFGVELAKGRMVCGDNSW